MKLVTITDLIKRGEFPNTAAWHRALTDVGQAIAAVRWPPEAPNFTIHPESGKRRGEGNGVKPIKEGFVTALKDAGWRSEVRYPPADDDVSRSLRHGAFDAWLDLAKDGWPPFVVEWETGNVSSSHRAINKMALGLVHARLSGGLLVLPTRELARFLTDRIGNYPELQPYLPLWSATPVDDGYLGIIAVEHDATSYEVPRISKGTSGRALI